MSGRPEYVWIFRQWFLKSRRGHQPVSDYDALGTSVHPRHALVVRISGMSKFLRKLEEQILELYPDS